MIARGHQRLQLSTATGLLLREISAGRRVVHYARRIPGLRHPETLLPRSALVSYSLDDVIKCLRSSEAPTALALRPAHCHIDILEDHRRASRQPQPQV